MNNSDDHSGENPLPPPAVCSAVAKAGPLGRPQLTIITVNYNHRVGLARTLESVAEQTFRDFEHMVIDGASTDGSRELIAMQAQQLARWISEPDNGIFAAMNKGLALARGAFVFFLNSGDRFAGKKVLEEIFGGGEIREDLIYGDYFRDDGMGNWKIWPQPEDLSVGYIFRKGLCHQTIFYRKDLFDELGGYDESLQVAADLEFNLRIFLAGKRARHYPLAVAYYEGRGISWKNKEKLRQEKEMILRRHFPAVVWRDYERLWFLERRCRELEGRLESLRLRTRLRNLVLALARPWDNIFLRLRRSGQERRS